MSDIFGYFLKRPTDTAEELAKRRAYAGWFVTSFPATELEGIDRVLYELTAGARKLRVDLSERYLNVFTSLDLKTIIIKNNIHVEGTEQLRYDDVVQAETATKTTKKFCESEYYRLLNTNCEVADFTVVAREWMLEQRNKALRKVLSSSFEMMSTLKGKNIGDEDALSHMSERTILVQTVYDMSKLEELASAHSEEDGAEFVMDTGLAPLDEAIGAFYTGYLVEVEGSSGAGKTRFTNGMLVHRAAVVYKKDVLFWALEQDKSEVEALLVSKHIFYLTHKQITSKMIFTKKVPEEYQELVRIAKIDLFESGKYGKIVIETADLFSEEFIEKISMVDDLKGPFDIIAVDHMGLVRPKKKTRGSSWWETPRDAYIDFKRYVRNTRKVAIAVNQLDRDNIKAAEADKEMSMAGGAGGMETRRSADIVIIVSATSTMQAQHLGRVTPLKARNSEAMDSVVYKTLLGICHWMPNETRRNI